MIKNFLFAVFCLFSLNVLADCPGMTVTPYFFNPSCNSSCDGHGYVSVSGGSGNYNYFFQDAGTGSPVGTQVNDSISGLCAGNYRVIVHDITNACFDTTLFTMVNPTPLVATVITNNNVSCFGFNDGQLSAFATGGTGAYTYLWSNGSTAQVANGLSAGVYWVIVTDANGCTFTATGTINQPNQLVVNTNSSPASCGACDGSAVGTAGGGTAPYTYFWTPGGFTIPTINNLCPGTQTLIVTDANGCSISSNVTIGTTSSVIVTANSSPSSCNPCDGTVTVLESGGTGPYLYDLTGMPQQTNGNFSSVCPGTYLATVTDNNGCVGFYTILVNSSGIPGLTVTDSVQAESGFGAQDGSIDLTLTGSTGPYTFTWSNGATTEDIYSLIDGTYTVIISDSNGDCQVYTFTVGSVSPYGFITGVVYNDVNGNCIYDGGDAPLSNYYVTVTDGTNTYFGITNTSGLYSIWVPSGNYLVIPYSSTNLNTSCTNSYSLTVSNGSNLSGNDFAYDIPPIYDVCVSTWSSGIVPGFNGYYNIYLNNYGNMMANGTVCLVLPSPLVFLSSIPSGATINGDTICFNYSNLGANGTAFYQISFFTPVSLPLGTPMVACVEATVTNGTDVNPACNNYCYTRIVSGSFDPNDKTVSPAGENVTGDIIVNEEEFTYLVRFQNTGTGPAVNITITDTLTSMLDPLSFEMLNASHPYIVEFINGNIIRWKFENIMLPDSGSNEPGSHGHVQFRLNTANTPVVGQQIENAANIYFDFNAPVITNTAVNTYVSGIGIEEASINGNLIVYPNPADEILYIQSLKGSGTYSIYDVTGKIILSQVSNSNSSTVDISSLSSGVYFIQYISGKEVNTLKFIKR